MDYLEWWFRLNFYYQLFAFIVFIFSIPFVIKFAKSKNKKFTEMENRIKKKKSDE